MSDHHIGYAVALEDELHEEDSRATIAAIMQIKGVVSVEPVLSGWEASIAKSQARNEITKALLKALREVQP